MTNHDDSGLHHHPTTTRGFTETVNWNLKRAEKSVRKLAKGNAYICYFNDRYDIDGETLKNKARYINHSCDPNCELQRTSRAIWVVALRDIREGEELTHRYNYEYDPEGYRDFPCFCGANNCVGYIVDQQYWESITQQRYQFAG